MTLDELAKRVAGGVPSHLRDVKYAGISVSDAVQAAVREFAQEYAEERMRVMREVCAESAQAAVLLYLEGFGTRRVVGEAVRNTPLPPEDA